MKISRVLGNRVLIEFPTGGNGDTSVRIIKVPKLFADQPEHIIVPEKLRSRPSVGVVRMLGNGPMIPPELKVGDTVKTDLEHPGEEAGANCRIISILDLICKIEQ
jgi:hypothetical protein